MTETELKELLDSLVEENERDFTVVFTPRRTRRKVGSYNAGPRRIKIYEKSLFEKEELIETGLHELAHHLARLRSGGELISVWHETKRYPSHGRVFKAILNGLLDNFNSMYAEKFQGVIVVYDRRAPKSAPRFLPFVDDLKTPEALRCSEKAVEKLLDAIFKNSSSRRDTVVGCKAE